jgi:hypothetical protein
MRKVAAEPYRDIDFSQAKQGAVVKAEPGKTTVRQVVREELEEAAVRGARPRSVASRAKANG